MLRAVPRAGGEAVPAPCMVSNSPGLAWERIFGAGTGEGRMPLPPACPHGVSPALALSSLDPWPCRAQHPAEFSPLSFTPWDDFLLSHTPLGNCNQLPALSAAKPLCLD